MNLKIIDTLQHYIQHDVLYKISLIVIKKLLRIVVCKNVNQKGVIQ